MPEEHQPAHHPEMNQNKPPGESNLIRTGSEAFVKSAGKHAGEQAVKYETDNAGDQVDQAKQKLDDAQEQAKGMFAKYCGCFGG